MTKDDRSAFALAYEAASKRVETKRRKIAHVRWKDGHLEVTTSPREKPGEGETVRGWDLASKRSIVAVEQGSLL